MAEALEAHCAQVESLGRAGFARRLRRTGWRANFISYDSTNGHVVKTNIFLVSYSFERIGKLLEERELRKISTSGTRSSLSRQDILEGGEKGRVDGVGRLKARTLKPAGVRHPIIAPVGLEFSLHCFLQFVMHWDRLSWSSGVSALFGGRIKPQWRRRGDYKDPRVTADLQFAYTLLGIYFRRGYEDRHGRCRYADSGLFGVVGFRGHLFISQKAAQSGRNETCCGGEVGHRLAGCRLRFGGVLSLSTVVVVASFTLGRGDSGRCKRRAGVLQLLVLH